MNVPVPLPRGITNAEDFPKARESLVNLVNIGGNKIVPAPGVAPYVTTAGACRGATFYRKRLFHASGETVTILPDSRNSPVTVIGSLQGVDQVFFAKGHTMMMILARGGQLLKWEDTGGPGTLTDVTSTPNFLTSVDCAWIGGRWCYCPADGSPVFYSEVGDGANILPVNFFDAELLPDDNLGLINVRNTLWVLGEEVLEPFRVVNNVDAPFAPVQGSQIQAGYISARIKYGPTFAFIGRNQKGHAGIFIAGQGGRRADHQ